MGQVLQGLVLSIKDGLKLIKFREKYTIELIKKCALNYEVLFKTGGHKET
jgi:hypothetical protein